MTKNEATSLLTKPWQKFLAKMDEVDTSPPESWKEIQLLGYFIKRFETHFKKQFALSFKGAPSKCAEIFVIKKTMAMLRQTDPIFIKDYIDWIFDKKIIPSSIAIRTIGFLITPGFGNEYLTYREKNTRITRSTPLPEAYQQIAQKLDLSVSTYGELIFAKMALEADPTRESLAPYLSLFTYLERLGFQSKSLEGVQ